MAPPSLFLDPGAPGLVPDADRNRVRQDAAFPRFLGCQAILIAVWAMFVEPGSEVIQPVLDAPVGEARQDEAPPCAKSPECLFNLAACLRRRLHAMRTMGYCFSALNTFLTTSAYFRNVM